MITKLMSYDDRANSLASSAAPSLQLFTTALVDDLWISILMFLSTEELLGIVNLIDRKLFGRLLQSEYLWYRLLMRDFPRWTELNQQTQPATNYTIDSCLDDNDGGNNNLGLNVNNDDDEGNQSHRTLLQQYRQLYHESMFPYDLEQSDVPVSRPYFVSNIWLVGQCIEYGPWFTDALKQRIVQRLTPPVAPLNPVIPPSLTFYLHHHHHHHDSELESHQLNPTSGTNAGWSQKMQLWQSCGPSRFQSCLMPFGKTHDMIVAVFDMDDEMNRLISDDNLLKMVTTSSASSTPSASPPSSLSIAQLYLYRLLRTWARRPPPAILVGISMSANRDDLRSEHVSTEDIRAWCSKQKISYMPIRSSEPDSQLYDVIRQMAVNNVSGVRHRKTMRSIPSQRKRPRPNTIGIQPSGASDGTTSCIIG